MKKSISLLCVVLLTLSILTGCTSNAPNAPASSSNPPSGAGSQSGKPDSSSKQPTNLYFYAWTLENNMTELINQFNKDYEGKYKLVYKKLNDAATMTINTALASGEQIDVMTQANAFDLRTRADSGNYLPLNEFFDKMGTTYAKVFGNGIEATQNINGKYYSIPYCRNIQMVYFNKKMFDKAGVKYPDPNWTWEDFRETARKLTSGSGANKVYGAMADFENEYWREIAMQKLGEFWFYNKDFTATKFENPAIKESLQYWYDLARVDKSVVPLDEYKALKYNNDTNGMIGLYQGKYAMFIVPVYGCLYLDEGYGKIPEGTDIGLTNMPSPAGRSKPVTTLYTSTMSIPANTKNKEGAWTLMKYVGIDRADLFAGPKAMHPGYSFANKEQELAFNKIIFKHPGLDIDMSLKVMAVDRDLVSEDNTIVQGQAEINELIKANISRVFNGEMSVDDCIKDFKTKGDAAVAKMLKK